MVIPSRTRALDACRDSAARWFDETAGVFADTPAASSAALERLLDFLCASQLYLRDNLRLNRPLQVADVKADPTGHWGACPPTNHLLAVLAPLLGRSAGRVRILNGAGHAGPALRAWTYLSGELGELYPRYTLGWAGHRALVEEFPGPLGGEVTPLLPGVDYMGGQLGPTLAYGQGLTLSSPDLVVPVIGDGECETGETAAAWLAGRLLRPRAAGLLLPVVLLNGFRMGSRSILGRMPAEEVDDYFCGLGYTTVTTNGSSIAATRAAVLVALRILARTPGRPPVLLLTMPKGATGPAALLDTPAMHKAPLPHPGDDPASLAVLEAWLRSYDPASLLGRDLRPLPSVASVQRNSAPPARPAPADTASRAAGRSFRDGVVGYLESRAADPGFRVFSPDEFSSNLRACPPGSALDLALVECLNEQVCHSWLEGHLAGGGSGLLVGYEGFAALTATHLTQYAKKMHLYARAGRTHPRSVTYLLSSTCWENSYTHQDPTLPAALLAQGDPRVRVFTPATVEQCLATLDRCLTETGAVNVVVAGKRAAAPHWPLPADRLSEPWSVWDPVPPVPARLALVAVGNTMVAEAEAARDRLGREHAELPVLLVTVNDLAALTNARSALWTRLGPSTAVVVATALHEAPVEALVGRALPGRQIRVVGFRDPGKPMAGPALLRHRGCDADALVAAGLRLAGVATPHLRRTA